MPEGPGQKSLYRFLWFLVRRILADFQIVGRKNQASRKLEIRISLAARLVLQFRKP
jgi:hypothetical protein